jgi:hypothetical protein
LRSSDAIFVDKSTSLTPQPETRAIIKKLTVENNKLK